MEEQEEQLDESSFVDEGFFGGNEEQRRDTNEIDSFLQGSFSPKQIGSIVSYVEPVSGASPIEDLVDMFRKQESLQAVPVEEYDRVVGVIDKKTVFSATSTIWKRLTANNVIDYAQRVDVILHANDFIEKALQKVSRINREYGVVYFPVFNNRRFCGLASLDDFLSRIAEIREQDLAKASVIQQCFFTQPELIHTLPYQFHAWNRMANALGGDIYQVYPLGAKKSLIGCFDVSGKNVAASLLTIAVGSFFKTLALDKESERQPLRIIALLDTYLQQTVPPGNFITAVFCYADYETNRLFIFNCGHTTTYLLYKDTPSAAKGKIAVINPALPPLGMGVVASTLSAPAETAAKRPYTVLRLMRGVHLNMYSDGFTDMQNDNGHRFEDERAKRFFVQLYDHNDEDVLAQIEQTVNEWIGETMLPDDVTVIDVRF